MGNVSGDIGRVREVAGPMFEAVWMHPNGFKEKDSQGRNLRISMALHFLVDHAHRQLVVWTAV